MLTLPSFAGPTSARSVTRTVRMRFSVGTRVRTDLFRNYIGAIERHEIVGPRIDAFYTEHLYCGEDDLFGSGLLFSCPLLTTIGYTYPANSRVAR